MNDIHQLIEEKTKLLREKLLGIPVSGKRLNQARVYFGWNGLNITLLKGTEPPSLTPLDIAKAWELFEDDIKKAFESLGI